MCCNINGDPLNLIFTNNFSGTYSFMMVTIHFHAHIPSVLKPLKINMNSSATFEYTQVRNHTSVKSLVVARLLDYLVNTPSTGEHIQVSNKCYKKNMGTGFQFTCISYFHFHSVLFRDMTINRKSRQTAVDASVRELCNRRRNMMWFDHCYRNDRRLLMILEIRWGWPESRERINTRYRE